MKTDEEWEAEGLRIAADMDEAINLTITAYKELLKQADRLASTMRLHPSDVLGKIMPKTLAARQDTNRILEWYEEQKEDAVHRMVNRLIQLDENEDRNKLIASLKLTPEQKSLLGI